jgi:hypothetical protein
VIGAVVFSHWILDLIVHRPDLPILPGNAGNLPLLGFGLWQFPVISALLELAIVLAGVYLYFRRADRSVAGSAADSGRQTQVLVTTGLTAIFILLMLAADFFNLSIVILLLLMLLLIVLCGWLDSRLHWSRLAV